MREIYLRAWDSASGRMLQPSETEGSIVIPDHRHAYIIRGKPSVPDWTSTVSVKLMQWTTRVDCNGTKIFEDDIISTAYGRSPVLWSVEHCAFVTRVRTGLVHLSEIPSHRMQVAGNNDQTPELIQWRYRSKS